jgi:SARP family transcriptional regulator, regulator of embCAB operon
MDYVSAIHEVPARTADRDGPVMTARLLGRFTIAIDGEVVDTQSSRRTRNILAYLLTNRRVPVPRDVLMEAFWPNVDEGAARNSLHVALTGARNALSACAAEPILQRTFDAYGISDSVQVWVDVEEFEHRCRAGLQAEREGDLERAVGSYELASQLYDGDFLADDPYADWAAGTRDSLQLLAMDVQSRLVDLYARRGDHAAALQLGRWLLASDPCNEGVHRRLMFCFARTGRAHLALAQYQRCADALWRAFRVRPGPETRALYERVRDSATRRHRTA